MNEKIKQYGRGLVMAAAVVLGTPLVLGFIGGLPILSILQIPVVYGTTVLGLLVAGGIAVAGEILIPKIKALK